MAIERQIREKTKDSRFPASIFAMYLGILLLMSGIHTGILVLMDQVGCSKIVQTVIPIIYWSLVAVGVTLYTRRKIKNSYDKPMLDLADATSKVANGDFSVYVPTIHTSDKLDYLDFMIIDFNKMVEELGSIETLKTDFISNVSHEMKTPLASIKNYAQLIQLEGSTQEQRIKYAAVIDESATRLSNLISNILKLNKLENQRITPEMERFDLCRQLTECILGFEEVWERKEIEMDIDMLEEVFVVSDPSLLELVWNNLLSNALKFTEPGGRIKITQSLDEKAVKVTVSDSGCGMSKEAAKHIFDKFYQEDTSHSKEGNGLGLALVKRVMDLVGGEITVISKEGEGSTFFLSIPKAINSRKEFSA